jgi:predicted dehydrogenase
VQVPAFREAGLEVIAIAGFHRDKTRTLAAELGLTAFDDWRDLVASDVDLVTIVTPPSEHREMAIAALEAGKHVLSEKPTALNAAEAEEMVAAARRHPERIARIDHELRFLPAWLATRERIAEIGPIRYVEVRYASPARGDRNRAWNWWNDASRGGGIWGAIGSHYVDALRFFGLEVESAQAVLRTVIDKRPFEDGFREVTSDDFAAVHLRLRGGAIAALTCSVVSGGPDEASVLTLHGENGAIRLVGAEALLSRGGRPFERFAGEDLDARPGNSRGGAFGTGTIHLGHALRAALDDGDLAALAPSATFEDGLAQQRVLDAASKASTGGGWVEV